MQEARHDQQQPPAGTRSAMARQPRSIGAKLVKLVLVCLGLLLISWLLYRTGWVREIAVNTLARLGRPAVPLLRRALHDEDHKVRAAAREALLGLQPEQVVPSLIESLRDTDPVVRVQACNALALLGNKAADAAPTLIPLLRDPDADVRRHAALAIAGVGPAAEGAMPDLLTLTQDPNPGMRVMALEALGRLGGRQANVVMPALIKCLDDDNANVRAQAADVLGNLARQGVKIEAAKAALLQASQDPESRVRREAAEALSILARKTGASSLKVKR